MSNVKTVGIKELKNNLSAYLRDVRRGDRILVSDRNDVVAELREPGARYETMEPADPIIAEWVERGVVVPHVGKKNPLPASPVKMKEGTAAKLLDADRGEKS